MARKLSERQQKILKYIESSVEERGYPPSIREIGTRVGISSTSVVDYNLRILERQGHLRRDREVSRGLEVVHADGSGRQAAHSKVVRIPVIGRIAAGAPIEAMEDLDDVLELPAGSVTADCYALRVRGNSMIDDHIEDGDVVVVRPQPRVDNGELAVAIVHDATVNGGATLKRVYVVGDTVRLEPRNPELQPIVVPADQVEIRGKVVQLLRDL